MLVLDVDWYQQVDGSCVILGFEPPAWTIGCIWLGAFGCEKTIEDSRVDNLCFLHKHHAHIDDLVREPASPTISRLQGTGVEELECDFFISQAVCLPD